jgi:hypothetical protein
MDPPRLCERAAVPRGRAKLLPEMFISDLTVHRLLEDDRIGQIAISSAVEAGVMSPPSRRALRF